MTRRYNRRNPAPEGSTLLGQGQFSRVMLHPTDPVVYYEGADPAKEALLTLSGKRHMPRLSVFDESDKTYTAPRYSLDVPPQFNTLLRTLAQHDGRAHAEAHSLRQAVTSCGQRFSREEMAEEMRESFLRRIRSDASIPRTVISAFRHMNKVAKQFPEAALVFDLHRSNFGYDTKRDELVLLDPLASLYACGRR